MAATTLRSDIRTRVRDYIYESTADWVTDAQLNRLINEELMFLPKKDVYLEERYTTTTVADQTDYALPTGTEKIELVEINEGTTAIPDWQPLKGWDVYAGSLIFNFNPVGGDTIRVSIKKQFTNPTGDVAYLDMPNEQTELLVWGVVCRVYRMFIGYFRNSRNWDSISKPAGVSISSIQAWLKDAEKHYNDLISEYATMPLPRDIDLVS